MVSARSIGLCLALAAVHVRAEEAPPKACALAPESACVPGVRDVVIGTANLALRATVCPVDGADAVGVAEQLVRAYAETFGVRAPDALVFAATAKGARAVQTVAGQEVAAVAIARTAAGCASITGHHWPVPARLALSPAALQTKGRGVFRCYDAACSTWPSEICDGKCPPPPAAKERVTWTPPLPQVRMLVDVCVDFTQPEWPREDVRVTPQACVQMPAFAARKERGALRKSTWFDLVTGKALGEGPCEPVFGVYRACPGTPPALVEQQRPELWQLRP